MPTSLDTATPTRGIGVAYVHDDGRTFAALLLGCWPQDEGIRGRLRIFTDYAIAGDQSKQTGAQVYETELDAPFSASGAPRCWTNWPSNPRAA